VARDDVVHDAATQRVPQISQVYRPRRRIFSANFWYERVPSSLAVMGFPGAWTEMRLLSQLRDQRRHPLDVGERSGSPGEGAIGAASRG
jgi:hypothetical protein